MSQQPLITIGLTCFNAQDTILRAIRSAQEQNYGNFEILVVDDGSSDHSVEIITEFIQTSPNVRLVIHKVNKGYPEALNSIMHNANGEYIAFFDDDDDSASDRLQKQLDRINTYKSLHAEAKHILCYTNREVYFPKSVQPDYELKAIGRTPKEPHGKIVADYLLWDSGAKGYQWGMFGSCTLMIATETLKAVNGFDPDFRRCAEWDMAIKAAFAGAHFIGVDEPLIAQHKTMTSDKSGRTPLKYSLLLREKHKSYLKKNHLYQASRLVARARYFGGQNKTLLSKIYMGLAALCAPDTILWKHITNKTRNAS